MIISVSSHKGGVGKSMSAIHLAAYFTRRFGEGSTVVVDADPNGTALAWQRRSKGRLPFPVVDPVEARGVMGEYDHAVVDTQGRPRGEGLERLVDGCDMLVVPSAASADDLEALMLMVSDLEELGGRAEYRVLLTMVQWWNREGPRAHAQLEKRGVPVFSRWVRLREAFRRASRQGVPVYELKERGARQGWEDYAAVGREILGEGAPA